MKYVQVTVRPDEEQVPEFFRVIAGGEVASETRLFDWNPTQTDRPVALYEVDGDLSRFREAIDGVPGVREATTARVSDGRFNLLVVFDPSEVSILQHVFETLTRTGLVVAKPVVYRDHRVHARVVGSADVLQSAVEALENEVTLDIVTVGDFDRSRDTPISMLSDRQREALLAALDLGYYEHPRAATHADIASRLGCEPNTASEHLQKAESKVLTEVLRLEYDAA